jgi:hypothetical protein
MNEIDSSPYFREITKAFLARRGAPFILPPKDLALVAAWKEAGVPLEVVLEGLAAAFDGRATSGRGGSRILSLRFCEASVARAYERFRDRNVGRPQPGHPAVDKRASVRGAIEAFLADVPAEVGYLREIFASALAKIRDPAVADEALEAIDERVDRLLRERADAAERQAAADELRAEYRRMAHDALAEAAAVRLVKRIRARHHVPYLSPYYYY